MLGNSLHTQLIEIFRITRMDDQKGLRAWGRVDDRLGIEIASFFTDSDEGADANVRRS